MRIGSVYLAGPIFMQSDEACKNWRAWFEAASPDVRWVDPMVRDYRGREDQCVKEIVEGDKADIDSVSAMVALVETPSAGTSMEVLYAWERGIPVVAITSGRVSPWIRYHSTAVVTTLEEALAFLRTL